MIVRSVIEPITCALCGGDRFAHRRDNGECMAFERASPAGRPYGMGRRDTTPVKGWVVTGTARET